MKTGILKEIIIVIKSIEPFELKDIKVSTVATFNHTSIVTLAIESDETNDISTNRSIINKAM